MLLVGPSRVFVCAGPGQGRNGISKQEPGSGRVKDADRSAFQNEGIE